MRESPSKKPRPTLPRTRKATPPAGTPAHEEWLLDEANEESFPASDASAPVQPSSTEAVDRLNKEGRKTQPTEKELARKKPARK
jgi:hypothetical protein